MATKKQKRRRQKLQRHEYEYVIETEEGEEVTVDRLSEEKAEKEKEKGRKQSARVGGRKIEPPSLQRVAKRTAIFGPLIVVLVFITSPSLSTSAKLFNALVLVAFFVPFSYMVDLIVYRVFRKRQGGGKPTGGKSADQ